MVLFFQFVGFFYSVLMLWENCM